MVRVQPYLLQWWWEVARAQRPGWRRVRSGATCHPRGQPLAESARNGQPRRRRGCHSKRQTTRLAVACGAAARCERRYAPLPQPQPQQRLHGCRGVLQGTVVVDAAVRYDDGRMLLLLLFLRRRRRRQVSGGWWQLRWRQQMPMLRLRLAQLPCLAWAGVAGHPAFGCRRSSAC